MLYVFGNLSRILLPRKVKKPAYSTVAVHYDCKTNVFQSAKYIIYTFCEMLEKTVDFTFLRQAFLQ